MLQTLASLYAFAPKNGFPTNQPNHQQRKNRNSNICGMSAQKRHQVLGFACGPSVTQQKLPGRTDDEEHDRMPVQPILNFARLTQRQIFRNSQCQDVTKSAPVQIARTSVMQGMLTPPVVIGGKSQNPDRTPKPVVGSFGTQKCPVPAIMLNGKQPNQHGRCRHRQQQSQPVTDFQRQAHGNVKDNKRNKSDTQLNPGSPTAACAIGSQTATPNFVICQKTQFSLGPIRSGRLFCAVSSTENQ